MPSLRCFLVSAVLLAAAGVLGALAFIHSGILNVAADVPHNPLTHWVFVTTRDNSIEARLDDVEVPPNLDAPDRIAAGAAQYDVMCAPCHLHPGMDESELYRGLNPTPPTLAEWSASPARSFWSIKHGIRSTGMPAWGRTHDDATLWDIVAFQRQLPDLTAEQYEAMVRDARQQGRAAH